MSSSPPLDLLGVVLTCVDARNKKNNSAAMVLIQEAFGDLVLPEQESVSSGLAAAQLSGRDVLRPRTA